jgi:hypothetical protein
MTMDIWQHAEKATDAKDRQNLLALGFDQCDKCGEWFHQGEDEWADCVSCGRHCPSCADEVEWEWCEGCGLFYCQDCFTENDPFYCQVCNEID